MTKLRSPRYGHKRTVFHCSNADRHEQATPERYSEHSTQWAIVRNTWTMCGERLQLPLPPAAHYGTATGTTLALPQLL